MKTSIITLLLLGAGLVLFQSNPALGACNPKCKQGQTCRFEQPNTFYCQNINGVQGSQQSSAGPAGQSVMQPRGGFDPRGNGGYRTKQGSSGLMASGCSSVSSPCVSLRVAGREIISSSIKEAIVKALRNRLELGTFGDFSLEANSAALQQFTGSTSRSYGPVFDTMLQNRFPEYPSLREIHKLQSMFPPVDQVMGNSMASEMAAIQAQFGIDSLLAAMNELKDIAIGSGGGVIPVVVAGLAAVSADAWFGAAVAVGIAVAQYVASQPGDYDEKGDLDGDGIPNDKDRDKDGDGKYNPAYEGEQQDNDDWDPNTITAESEGRMMLTSFEAPYQMMHMMQRVFSAYGNMFYQIRY